MKKLKTLMPLLLSLMLLMPPIYAQSQTELPKPQSNDYGIEPEKSYPGALILELLQVLETEIDSAVAEAYAAGYKAGVLAYAPDVEYWKAVAVNEERRRKEAERKKWLYALGGFGIGFLGGNGTGIAIGIKIMQ